MSHLIYTDRDSQYHDIILANFNFYSIGVTHAKPLLGDLCHLVPSLADGVLVIQDVALNFQVRTILDFDGESVAYWTNDGFFDHGNLITIGIFNFHAVLYTQFAFLNLGQYIPIPVFELQRVTYAHCFAIYLECLLALGVFDPKIVANGHPGSNSSIGLPRSSSCSRTLRSFIHEPVNAQE
jgi:hypothetical protein